MFKLLNKDAEVLCSLPVVKELHSVSNGGTAGGQCLFVSGGEI